MVSFSYHKGCVILLIDTTQSGQAEDSTSRHNADKILLGGLTWITLVICLAGVMGYVIGEDIGVFTGALCAIVTGVVCIGVIQWVHCRI